MAKRTIWQLEDPCPCGSGKLFLGCCMAPDGHVQKILPTLAPPGRETGFVQRGCYLSTDQNCSEGLTGEHYVSRMVLKSLGDQIRIEGMPWLGTGESKIVGLNSLTANLLCERHNNALSPLDDEAGKLSDHLDHIHKSFGKRSLSRRNKAYLLSGEAVELWLLKLTCGVCLSFGSVSGIKLKTDHIFDLQKISRAFNQRLWDDGGGMYLRSSLGNKITGHAQVSIAPLTVAVEKWIVGSRTWVRGLEFDLLFDVTGVDLPGGDYTHRPSTIEFRNERRSDIIVLTWPRGLPKRHVQFTAGARA